MQLLPHANHLGALAGEEPGNLQRRNASLARGFDFDDLTAPILATAWTRLMRRRRATAIGTRDERDERETMMRATVVAPATGYFFLWECAHGMILRNVTR